MVIHAMLIKKKIFLAPKSIFRSEQGFLKIGSQWRATENDQVWEVN